MLKATHGVGSPRFDSGRKLPFPSIIFTPSPPASGCSSIKAIIFRKVSSSTTVSGFSNKIYLPEAFLMAWLLAFENPRFFLFSINFTSANLSRTSCAEPSTELLSTTNTSTSIFFEAFCTACRHCSKKCFTL